MSFFCHSFAARLEADRLVYLKGERDIATAALAGFRIDPEITGGIWSGLYKTWSPSGEFLGYNNSRSAAAAYCLRLLDEPGWAR